MTEHFFNSDPIEISLEVDNSPDPEFDYDHNELVSAIRAKAKHSECPVCEANTWFVPDSLVTMLAGTKPDGSIADAALAVLPWICKSCNYVRFHAGWQPVGGWAAEAGDAT